MQITIEKLDRDEYKSKKKLSTTKPLQAMRFEQLQKSTVEPKLKFTIFEGWI